MKPKATIRWAVDLAMTLTLLFLMGYHLFGEIAHEWVGAAAFLLWGIHHILNWGWYKGLFRGRYTPLRAVQAGVCLLLTAAMLALLYSGIVMSRHVFVFLPHFGGMALARRLHILGASWGFLLMSLHLGLHWGMVLGLAKKRWGRAMTSPAGRRLLLLAGVLIAAYGVFVLFDRGYWTWLFLRSEFIFLDYEEPVWAFLLDHLCLMGSCVFLGYFGSRGLRTRRP